MEAEPRVEESFVEEIGKGPALVWLHGFGGSGRNFRGVARSLRERWRVLLPDLRGHARSPSPEDPREYRESDYVADLAGVLDRAGVSKAVVGGLSMGAAVALAFALAHPERVRALVLVSFPGAKEGGGISAIATRFAERIERDGLDAAGAEFVWGPKSGFGRAAATFVRQGFLEHRPLGLAAALRGFLAPLEPIEARSKALAGFERPVLVIAGERDTVSLAPSRELAARLPQAELVVVPGAGHVVNLEAPAAFLAAVDRFIGSLPPEAA